jgi:hypothetical protein
MNKKWLLIERTPMSFMFLLWLFGLNMGISVIWGNGPLLILHAFRQMSQEEHEEATK